MEDHQGLKQFLDGYMKSFDRLDGDSAASHYSAPSFVVKNGDVNRFDETGKSGYFSDLMASNAQVGEHGWEIAEFDVAELAANGAVVTVRWVARRPDHCVVWDFRDTYIVGDDGDGWRILGDIVHDTL